MKKTHPKSQQVVQGLLDYLSETDQTRLLPDVADTLKGLFASSKAAKEIIVTSSVELDNSQVSEIGKIMNKILSVNLPVKNIIDEKILGGLTISVGDWYLDASLSHTLKNLKNKLLI